MKRYVEQVVDNIYNRGKIVEIDIPTHMIDCYGHEVVNGFSSHFTYTEDILAYVEETGGIKGYTGPMTTDALVWDFDGTDLDQVKNDVSELLHRLDSMGIDDESIRIYYSGNKGFHVYLLSADIKAIGPSVKLPSIVKHVCMDIAEGLSSCDSSIYDRTRIIRIANSKHHKSGRYKTYISRKHFTMFSGSEIEEYASTQRKGIPDGPYATSDYIGYAIKTAINKTDGVNERKNTRLDLLEGIYNGFEEGNGNVGMTSIAGMLHSKNISPDMIKGFLYLINKNWENPMPESSIDTIVQSVIRYPIDAEYALPDTTDIVTMASAAERWEILKKTRNYLNTGFKELDQHLINFDPGKVLMIAARGGVGKTLLGMQIGNTMAKNQDDGYNLFISVEMPSSAIYYRAAQIERNESGEFEDAKSFTELLLSDNAVKRKTIDNWSNTLIVDKSSISMDKIKNYFLLAQEKYGGKVKNILIDYVGLLEGTDDYKGMSKVAKSMKHLAKELNTRIILLVQVSRKGGDGTVPVTLDMLRDAGTLEEAADMVLGLWLSPSDNTRIHARFIKNRDGERHGQFDLLQKGLSYTSVPFDDSADALSDEAKRW